MTTTTTHLVAQEHINDLLREARRAQTAAPLRRKRRLMLTPRRLRLSRPRTATA
ncbi:MAG: hypothetical protein ACRDPA_20455 [Solirubrobacteraceae bacterium]